MTLLKQVSLLVLFVLGVTVVECFTHQCIRRHEIQHDHQLIPSRRNHRLLLAKDEAAATTTDSSSSDDPAVNGDGNDNDSDEVDYMFSKLEKLKDAELSQDDVLPEAPHLSYEKYLTMQDKRVPVTIRYSGGAGLKPYFLTVAKKLKMSHPDVVVERLILPTVSEGADVEATFEVLVDRKVVVGNGRLRKQLIGNVDMSHGRSVFVSMQELDLAISRARRRRRPSTLYGDDDDQSPGLGLEMLRKTKDVAGGAMD